jgi:hypothetical protein
MSTHCGICFGQGHSEKSCQATKNQVEVHEKEVYFKGDGIHHWRLVGSCTSPEAAQAIARLLSY